jgi:cation transport regulator ChaC
MTLESNWIKFTPADGAGPGKVAGLSYGLYITGLAPENSIKVKGNRNNINFNHYVFNLSKIAIWLAPMFRHSHVAKIIATGWYRRLLAKFDSKSNN